MTKVALLTDSSADMSLEESQKYNIHVIRMPLMIDGKEFIEEEEISRDDLIKAMRDGKMVSTAQPSIGKLILKLDELLKENDKVVFVPISSNLSGTYQTAMALANEDYKDKLIVVDALLVAAPLFSLLCDMRRLLDEGMEPIALKHYVEKNAYMFATLIPEEIVYLKRGGRISSTAAAVANLLKIVPVLSVTDGKIDLLDKVRTHKKAVKRGLELVLEQGNPDDYYWYVVDGDTDPKLVSHLVSDVKKALGVEPMVRKLYPIILAHTGPGTVALTCCRKI